jgi:hypothetical protein
MVALPSSPPRPRIAPTPDILEKSGAGNGLSGPKASGGDELAVGDVAVGPVVAVGDAGWTKTFTDPRLCAAIVDRLTFAGSILKTDTESCRLAQARAQRTA